MTVATLLAPFTPFIAEELWRNLAAGRGGRPDSVPSGRLSGGARAGRSTPGSTKRWQLARALVELGRRVRVETKTKTRQPLSEAAVSRRRAATPLSRISCPSSPTS